FTQAFLQVELRDGQLFDLHHQHCYYTAPNIAESMLLAPLLNLLMLSMAYCCWCCYWYSCSLHPPSSHQQWCPVAVLVGVLIAPLTVLASEIAYDISRNMSKHRTRERLPEVRGVARVIAAAGASCVIATLEAGRMVGHWKRGGLKAVGKSFCRRFDWHCGRQEGAVEGEARRALGKV
ncbi:unnamed protein product, partial [Laminaria digitata]